MTEPESPRTDAPIQTAWGHGLATVAADGTVLDVWFPHPALGIPTEEERSRVSSDVASQADEDPVRNVRMEPVTTIVDLTAAPVGAPDAYLRLTVLSHLLARPNTINLDAVFAHLTTVAWTNAGPVHPDELDRARPRLRAAGIRVHSLDKFPPLLDYVTPAGVRIADGARVRLGAYLSPGTTVMHEGFVNYNAGTLGSSMIEGRVSQGVVVGDGSDIGGGASIMGTLSGGGTERISVGRRALLGANSGIGISIGDDTVVESGLYVTAGTKVQVTGDDGRQSTVKAVDLSGVPGLLFRRNSVSGAVETVPRTGSGIQLNTQLHTQ